MRIILFRTVVCVPHGYAFGAGRFGRFDIIHFVRQDLSHCHCHYYSDDDDGDAARLFVTDGDDVKIQSYRCMNNG